MHLIQNISFFLARPRHRFLAIACEFPVVSGRPLSRLSLSELEQRLLGLSKHYREIAKPFDWTSPAPTSTIHSTESPIHQPRLELAA
jgi:hypothetical protein